MQLNPVRRRQGIQNFRLVLGFEVFQNADGVVALKITDAFGHGLVRQFREDLLADVIVHLGQRGEVEFRAHHFDELGPQLRFEGDDQKAEIRFVQAPGQCLQLCRIPRFDGDGHIVQEFRHDRAIFIVDRRLARVSVPVL